jgi:hypothetical protein
VGLPELINCDISAIIRDYSLADAPERAPVKLRAIWGRACFSFKLDDDPRPVPAIPEARQYVAAPHDRMPYFAGCLCLSPLAGMFYVYFGCLADPDGLYKGKPPGLKLDHPSVVGRVREALAAIALVASVVGIDPRPTFLGLLAPYGPEAARQFFPEWAEP